MQKKFTLLRATTKSENSGFVTGSSSNAGN